MKLKHVLSLIPSYWLTLSATHIYEIMFESFLQILQKLFQTQMVIKQHEILNSDLVSL